MSRRYLFVINPAAGRNGLALAESVLAAMRARGVAPAVHYTCGPGDATRWLRAQSALPDVVVAAGGDGTINEVINGLDGRDAALGLIPGGTTNVLATELDCPSRAADIAEVLLAGREEKIHLARLNGRRFGMMAGVGYDAWVVAGVDPATKKRVGKLAYVLSMLKQLRRFGEQRYRITVDGVPHDAHSAVITNGRHYAGSYILARDADIRQPVLDVVLVQTSSATRFLAMLLLLPLGLVQRLSFIRTVRGRDIVVEQCAPLADTAEPVQADGDTVSELPARICVEDTPTRILVPVGGAAKAALAR
jgi:diacylglycerol kinase (ATP)